jgi:hypothetical protein
MSFAFTGTIDMDLLATGKTALDRDLVFKLSEQAANISSLLRNSAATLS